MIRVIHIGLGPIGAAVAAQIAARKGFRIVGAVDTDPLKVGLDLGAVIGAKRKLRVVRAHVEITPGVFFW
jgi:4-hydroxy-tetrahydrodipicolinate reductase